MTKKELRKALENYDFDSAINDLKFMGLDDWFKKHPVLCEVLIRALPFLQVVTGKGIDILIDALIVYLKQLQQSDRLPQKF